MLIETVKSALAGWPAPKAFGARVVVPTQCITSGGEIIHVVVEGGNDSFVVHDDGAAIRIFEDAGADLKTAPKMVASLLRDRGLNVHKGTGVISSPRVTLPQLAATIAVVANAARESSDHLLHRWKPVVRKKFKEAVQDLLEHEYPKRWAHDRAVVGHSNKKHTFDFSISLGDDRQLLFDAVVPDQSAISSAVVRHLDVAKAHDPKIVQQIVYDDRVEWKSSDLNLLNMSGAVILPFASAKQAIDKLAA
ncbi:hypothetical protein GCM10007897_43680 [Sphingobium jiangsuense]|uniref:DUF1828 domain-containing protein n=1 Tax=Sphingobium jiangsuense TaxID=870476 RepID=A0A7W6FRQ4_9SPHN|nr:hypothetical protein [Sphingobium jiangsuense]MBB3928290.1 hypothetical protein [Sphingobium jiangsuense]GLT02938.1 hypothetical protein GCM10007897_43680 [Sphingobium jiangsuense]